MKDCWYTGEQVLIAMSMRYETCAFFISRKHGRIYGTLIEGLLLPSYFEDAVHVRFLDTGEPTFRNWAHLAREYASFQAVYNHFSIPDSHKIKDTHL
jgi:hypothetical protein